MVKRLRTTGFAGSSALVLVLIVSGVVAAASLLTAAAAPQTDPTDPVVVDTTATFEDVDGDGIDDDCDDAVVADQPAADAANAAVDANGDGTVSVSEAAHSNRVGGMNCNHGGYVSQFAHGSCDAPADSTPTGTDADGAEGGDVNADEASTGGSEGAEDSEIEDAEAPDADCTTEEPETEAPAQEQAPTCDAAPAGEDTSTNGTETTETETTDTPKNHGAVVREVAKDKSAVGGKNCNHGGAVSAASHQDNEARKAERDAAKAERAAERAAAKAAHEAAKGTHGNGKNKNR